jgi:hypothetical protein
MAFMGGVALALCPHSFGSGLGETNRFINHDLMFSVIPSHILYGDIRFGKQVSELKHVNEVNIQRQPTPSGLSSCFIRYSPILNCGANDNLAPVPTLFASLGVNDNANGGQSAENAGNSRSEERSGSSINGHEMLLICCGIAGGHVGGCLLGILIAKGILRWT